MSELALNGGAPVRPKTLPYGGQWLDDEDVAAVTEVLRSSWLTTGPAVAAFERDLAERAGVEHAVAVSSGTAALHAIMHALDVGPGDEVVVPCVTFVATANAVLYQGGTPVFADVDPQTLLVDPASVAARITPRTKAIVAVDYAGQPCDYDALRALADDAGAALVADACHSLGGSYRGRPVGSLADLSAFSFHPVKVIATGEGGMVTTADAERARRMRAFRNHGIDLDFRERERAGVTTASMVSLGNNYRLPDVACALGASQLRKLGAWVDRRRELAARYDALLADVDGVEPLVQHEERRSAYHLYVVRLASADRDRVLQALRAEGIGATVHYLPVHLHPYYREHLQTEPGLCPAGEDAYGRILSLPLFPRMSEADQDDVLTALRKVLAGLEA